LVVVVLVVQQQLEILAVIRHLARLPLLVVEVAEDITAVSYQPQMAVLVVAH
jgi:hypothetical protein